MSSAVDGDVLSALEAQHAELAGIIDPLDEAAWQRPSRCEGWSVADVVLHLVQTDQLAMASLADRIDAEVASIASGDAPVANVDEGAELAVQRERGLQRRRARRPLACEVERATRRLRQGRSAPARHVGSGNADGAHACRRPVFPRRGSIPATSPSRSVPHHNPRIACVTSPVSLGGRCPYAFARSGRSLSGPVAFHLRAPSGETWEFEPRRHRRRRLSAVTRPICASSPHVGSTGRTRRSAATVPISNLSSTWYAHTRKTNLI